MNSNRYGNGDTFLDEIWEYIRSPFKKGIDLINEKGKKGVLILNLEEWEVR